MFRLIIEDQNIDYKLNNANEVTNVVFNNTNEWMLASQIRQECSEAKSGDRFEYEDAGVTIECI